MKSGKLRLKEKLSGWEQVAHKEKERGFMVTSYTSKTESFLLQDSEHVWGNSLFTQ